MIKLENNYTQDKYLKYAQDVISGKQVAGKLIKLSCQRYLDFMNDARYEFRPDKCERVLSFVGKLKHYQGKCAGKPFVLEEWQKWIIYSIFGFYYKDSNERLVKKALLTVGRKNGKAISLDTNIPTPFGNRLLRDIHEGDIIFGADGKPTRVLFESEIQYRPCYKILFENGEEIISADNHRWLVKCRNDKKPDNLVVRTTQEMYDKGIYLQRKDGKGKEYNWRTILTNPVEYEPKEYIVDPYVLGLWLGDGDSAGPEFTTQYQFDDYKIYDYVSKLYGEPTIVSVKHNRNAVILNYNNTRINNHVSKLSSDLKKIGVFKNKHIPEEYKFGSVEQRLSLIQGLMDTDGSVASTHYHQCEFVQKRKDIVDDVQEILSSLGIKSKIKEKYVILNGKKTGPYYRLTFFTDKTLPVFKMKRKYEMLPEHLHKRMKYNTIRDIIPCETVPCKCLTVDNEDHLFLCGKQYTVTHNTFLIAAIALYMLIADGEPAAQVLNIANNTKQAHLLFEMQQKLVKCLDPKHKYTKTLRDSIQVPKTSSYSQVLSSDSSGHDGSSPSTYILDEVHEMKDSKLWDVMISGTGFRVSPLGICISTSGFLLNGFLHNYRDVCIDILEHRKEDDEQFAAIYELDEEDDWKDEHNWIKANPNLGVTVTKKYLEGQIRSAINDSALETSVKTKNFNMWVSSKEIWISDDKIRKVMAPVNLEDYKDEECFMGVDLSAVSDLTSTTIMFPPNPDREVNPDKFVFKTIIYLPESELTENVNSYLYMIWKRENYLKVTSGNVVDYDFILKDQININDTNYIVNVAYDKWNATQWAINATSEGLPLSPYSQALGNFNGPTKTLERLIRTGQVIIDNNPIVRWAFSNVSLKIDHHENAKPTKANDEKSKKIDPVISMIQSLGGYLSNPRYSDGQVLTVK